MSMYGAQFLKNIGSLSVDGVKPDVQFKEYGYLFLAGERSRHIIDQNHSQQVACGADWIKKYESSDLRDLFPWLNISDLAVGTYSTENEGFFDPWLFVQTLRRKAVSMGVDVINGSVHSARLSSASAGSSSFNIDSVMVSPTASPTHGSVQEPVFQLSAERYINAAGAWSGKLVEDFASSANTNRHAGIRAVPVKPRKRCIFNIQCKVPSSSSSASTGDGNLGLTFYYNPDPVLYLMMMFVHTTDRVPPLRTPLVVDPTGVYFRPEGNILGRFLAGVSPSAEKDYVSCCVQMYVCGMIGFNWRVEFQDCSTSDFNALDDVSYDLFEETIWPVLFQRVPSFGELKVVSSWAGFYDYNTLDQVNCYPPCELYPPLHEAVVVHSSALNKVDYPPVSVLTLTSSSSTVECDHRISLGDTQSAAMHGVFRPRPAAVSRGGSSGGGARRQRRQIPHPGPHSLLLRKSGRQQTHI